MEQEASAASMKEIDVVSLSVVSICDSDALYFSLSGVEISCSTATSGAIFELAFKTEESVSGLDYQDTPLALVSRKPEDKLLSAVVRWLAVLA